MDSNTALVITSIAPPNRILQIYAKECANRGVQFILVGDAKSPSDFALPDCDFWGIDRQKQSDFELAKNLPENHYARKNIGYLVAMRNRADVIIETDDDNIPTNGFWDKREMAQRAHLIAGKGWVNAYKYFTKENIWPRGFALDHLQATAPSLSNAKRQECLSPIQQGLADENPDVDAIYRLLLPLPIKFNTGENVAVGANSWCPFNSQNTTWFRDAFPLLYLPAYVNFRMTDIWRSFVAQRIAWTCGWNVLFHKPTVKQERNPHNLFTDFENEMTGYLMNGRICKELENLDLKKGRENIYENLEECYKMLAAKEYIEAKEIAMARAWIADCRALGI